MTAVAVDILLGVAVLMAWLGSFGFLRFSAALDRLHCAAFVNVAVGTAVTMAALAEDGLSDRSLKIMLVFLIQLICGAATIHAVGRAVMLRGMADR